MPKMNVKPETASRRTELLPDEKTPAPGSIPAESISSAFIEPSENAPEAEIERELLLRISAELALCRDKKDLLGDFLENLKSIFRFDDAVLSLYDEDFKSVRHFHMTADQAAIESPARRFIVSNSVPLAGNPHEEFMAFDGPTIIDFEYFAAKYEGHPGIAVMRELGLSASLIMPLRLNRRLLGMLEFHARRAGVFRSEQKPLYRSLADQVAVAVSNIEANEEIIAREKEKETLLAINQAIAHIRDRRELFDFILNKVKPLFGFNDLTLLLTLGAGGRHLDYFFTGESIKAVSAEARDGFENKIPVEGLYREVVAARTAYIRNKEYFFERAPESDINRKIAEGVRQVGLEQVMVAPLLCRGEFIGSFHVHTERAETFTERQLPLFQAVADQIAVAVANILATEEILRRDEEKTRLLKISEQIAAVREYKQLLKVLQHDIKPFFAFDNFGLYVLDDDGEKVRELFDESVPVDEIQEKIFQETLIEYDVKEFADDAWMRRNDITVSSLAEQRLFFPGRGGESFEIGISGGLRQMIGGPLYCGGRKVGFLSFNSKGEDFYGEKDIPAFKALADLVAVAVDNLSAKAEILRREREKDVLLAISDALTTVRVKEDLLRVITDKIKPLFTFDDAVIALIKKDEQTHSAFLLDIKKDRRSHRNFQKVAAPDYPIVDGIVDRVIDSHQPCIFDVAKEARRSNAPGYIKFLDTTGIKEIVVAKLRSAGAVIGMLYLQSTVREVFSPDQFRLLQAISDQLGTAVSNILANSELLEREREKSAHLEIVSAVTAVQDHEKLVTELASKIDAVIPLDAFAVHLQRDGDFLNFECNDVRAVRGENGEFSALRRYSFWKRKGVSKEKLRELIEKSLPLLAKKAFYNGEEYLRLAVDYELIGMISEEFGFRSIMYLPVALHNGALMTLAVSSRQKEGFSHGSLQKLAEIGAQIALAMDSNLSFAEIIELKKRLEAENTYLAEEVKTAYNFAEIVGYAPALQEVFRRVELVAPTDSTVLLEGETGTGKELFARAIHDLSPRQDRPLIKVNCAALPAALIESELFGHERGAFTGASERRLGKFELANNGTIFLDEIGELPPELQAKLLRVLQEREVERIGGRAPLKIDIRVIAATNRDLRAEIAEKRFRQDLYFRLNTVTLSLPPLRERREDIPVLAVHFAQKYASRIGRRTRGISNKMLHELMRYDFPGNVRELEHIVEEAVIFSKGDALELHRPLSFEESAGVHRADVRQKIFQIPKSLAELEREHILAVLERTGGRIRGEQGAAEILDIKPTTLEARMKKLGITRRHIFSGG